MARAKAKGLLFRGKTFYINDTAVDFKPLIEVRPRGQSERPMAGPCPLPHMLTHVLTHPGQKSGGKLVWDPAEAPDYVLVSTATARRGDDELAALRAFLQPLPPSTTVLDSGWLRASVNSDAVLEEKDWADKVEQTLRPPVASKAASKK